MTSALALPSGNAPVPAGWAEQTGAEVVAIEDLDYLNEGAVKLDAAIAGYKRQGQDVAHRA